MIGFVKRWWPVMLVVPGIIAFSACRKPADAVKSDLGEAGYQLTADDWFRAARANDATALARFVKAGFKPDTRDFSEDTALHAAAASGAEASADFLLDHGIPIDSPGTSGRTPLMAAVLGNQARMIRWLLRQGADPNAKDADGFPPLMLAVREGHSAAVAELAAVHGDKLDAAILLAALVGQTEVIDTLTNYGASVYARMEDGRTPLMITAENGHSEATKLLLDIGASRFSTDNAGRTAADLASAAGHAEIAALIVRDPQPGEIAIESASQIALAFGDPAAAAPVDTREGQPGDAPSEIVSIENQTLSAAVVPATSAGAPVRTGSQTPPAATGSGQTSKPDASPSFPMPPLVMRQYRERELPLRIRGVDGESATIEIIGTSRRELRVKPGETIPDSRLVVTSVRQRVESSKLNLGRPTEVSVVEVRDTTSGETREWITGLPAAAHDPVALIEDTATGKRYLATPGRSFKSADGTGYIVSDVRPNQIVIENTATGATRTLPLRGTRG